MDIAEATRQYQIALEHERRVRELSFDLVTFEDDREDARADLADAGRALDVAWMGHACR